MDVESVPGRGTTFTVFFPAAVALAPPVVMPRVAVEAPEAGTILFVDDEPAIRMIGKASLERSGYSVLLASSGKEAVDIFRQNAGQIATVLLDMTMPVMGGREALRLIREIRPEVPVILMTGFSEDLARDGLDASVVAGFVQKPYTSAKLVEAIRTSLGDATGK
jgi:two-component system cell cycle sensor histidine kinase/response regulator CckA